MTASAQPQPPVVFLLDDETSVRTALRRGLAAEGIAVRAFDSADAFLAEHDPEVPGCLVTDVAMPGMTGLELQSSCRPAAARGRSSSSRPAATSR